MPSVQQTIIDYTAGTASSSPMYQYVYASYINESVMRAGSTYEAKLYYHRNEQRRSPGRRSRNKHSPGRHYARKLATLGLGYGFGWAFGPSELATKPPSWVQCSWHWGCAHDYIPSFHQD